MIRERVNAGLARARAKGRRLGGPPTKPAVEVQIRKLRAKVPRDNQGENRATIRMRMAPGVG
jgi:DNA invertase Pin-like site-specific DNA recombinase